MNQVKIDLYSLIYMFQHDLNMTQYLGLAIFDTNHKPNMN
jgi:hypothetical protein